MREMVIEWMWDVAEVAEDASVVAWDYTAESNWVAALRVLKAMGVFNV